jgi:hypothetical protein
MNGMAKDGFLNLFLGNYGVGIDEDEVGSGLGFEVHPNIIVETKLNENDSRILTTETQARQEQLLLWFELNHKVFTRMPKIINYVGIFQIQ